uniref:C2H2-type domain-containing protein n=1 Tax=Plectus sambesii TaxID=2011161 RepID=A0A914WG11_9BILA
MRFKRSTYLKRHLLVHLPKSSWDLTCPTCAKVCTGRRDNFERHVKACAKPKSSAPDPLQVLSIKRRDRRPVVRLGTEIPFPFRDRHIVIVPPGRPFVDDVPR